MRNTATSRPTHADLQKRIRNATDVTDFDLLYNDMDFIMERVNRAQLEHGKRWDWSVVWESGIVRTDEFSFSFVPSATRAERPVGV